MNAKIKDKKEPNSFKPFTLEIDVDTLDELKYLWMAINMNLPAVIEHNKKHTEIELDIEKIGPSKYELWKKLDNKLLEVIE